MAHHKRGRPKHRRGGCLLCKPHKRGGRAKRPRSPKAVVVLQEPVREIVQELVPVETDDWYDDSFYDDPQDDRAFIYFATHPPSGWSLAKLRDIIG